ncbi:Acetylcholine Receptor [Chamberlinius hualienensis]
MVKMSSCALFVTIISFTFTNIIVFVSSNPDAKRLYDDLLSNYNRLIRPVSNNSEMVTVRLGLKLSQLIDLNLKNQIMTSNVWMLQVWSDYKLTWEPEEYGGVTHLYVPSELLWIPDIVLYNNADGHYVVTTMTKAIIYYNGTVVWKPPAIFKSYCEIDVKYFPFDQQQCFMKFGSWTYDGSLVDLQHMDLTVGGEQATMLGPSEPVEVGIDLKEYYPSVEWDVIAVPAIRNVRKYECCEETYPDIVFNISLRRKTLFYTVNLIIPCVGISYLSVLVFYLPVDSGEKVTLSISIMLSLVMFFMLITEIMPSTSLAVPLLVHYKYPAEIERAIVNLRFIAQHMANHDQFNSLSRDWKYVAMVLDRLFLWIFGIATVAGTFGIMCQAPTLYDDRLAIDILISTVQNALPGV